MVMNYANFPTLYRLNWSSGGTSGATMAFLIPNMLRLTISVVSLLLPSTLCAQYVSGTVVVLEDSGDYIVIAADSLRLGPRSGQVSHDACKIVKLSDQLVFAASGISGHPRVAKTAGPGTWDVYDVDRQEDALLGDKQPH